jgi:hypothetical protein
MARAILVLGLGLLSLSPMAIAACQRAGTKDVEDAGGAKQVMELFWENTDHNRFGANGDLLADDIVFIDPIWGRYEGKEAAAKFLASFDGASSGCCTLDRLVTDGDVGWAFWTLHTPGGEQPWVGVYQVEDGKIVFYQDIHQRTYTEEEQKAHAAAFARAKANRAQAAGKDG